MIIFVSGKSGCGKSTLIAELIKELKEKGKKVAGIISPEIRKTEREGFEIIDIASTRKEILASLGGEGPRVSKYHVNVEGIKKIVAEFEKSFEKADVIVIDEIGKMELCSKEFETMLEKIFNSGKPVVATLHRNYLNSYGKRGKLFWLEKRKLQQIKEKILELLNA